MFKNVDTFKDLALGGEEKESPVSPKKLRGLVLRSINEFTVRKLCGDAIFGAGLQSYLQGRVSDKRFSSDTLSGKLDESGRKWLSDKDAQFFEPTITLERKGSKIHTYGNCGCNLAGEGSLCPHMAALMIAWVRRREDFEERVSEHDLELARGRVMDSLRELVNLIEKGGSSKTTDLEVIQKTYSRLKLWAEQVSEVGNNQSIMSLREFSHTINHVSFALISAIENKYQVRATDLYNRNTVSTFGKVLDSLAKTASRKKPIARKLRSRTVRSWDKLIDDFAAS